jgi:DNA-binding PadR family transcriptional regulator
MLAMVHLPEGNVKMPVEVNATQGSLLGFLYDAPKTGWDLLQEIDQGLARFWNVTPSHVYRELRTLQDRKLVTAGRTGVRDRRPFTITAAGKKAFKHWIAQEPGPEQIRNPLLITLWFGRHLDDDTLAAILESNRDVHAKRLRYYESITDTDRHTGAVVAFGVAYEKAVIAWIDELTNPPRSGATSGAETSIPLTTGWTSTTP